MIYTTKRFSYQGKASGALVGLSAGALLGDKIEKKIIDLKHSHSYSKDKLIKLLEDEKKNYLNNLKDAEEWKKSDPKGYREALPDLDFSENVDLLKKEISKINSEQKKIRTDPEYGKRLWDNFKPGTSGKGSVIGGTLGSIGGFLGGHYIDKRFSSNFNWKLGKKINLNLIREAERTYNIKLPEDYKETILQNNNARPSLYVFDTESSKEHVFKLLLSLKRSDLENIYNTRVDANLYPFGSDPFGNVLCFDKFGVVWYWLHETETKEKVANSFTEFINNLYQ